MAAQKKIVLPPRPVRKPAASAPVEKPRDPTDLKDLKVVEYKITFEDGTCLIARGDRANAIFHHFAECEQRANERQLVSYLGATFAREAADGTVLAEAVTS